MEKYKGEITLNEFLLVNINLINSLPRYVIRLKNEKEYPVLSTSVKNGKTKRKEYFIKIDDKYYKLNDTVKKLYITEKRRYSRCGI
jgi:hypothetical protein